MTTATRPTEQQVWGWLAEVPDPEIPAVSVVDLGIVRDVAWDGDELAVAVTPTYSGCPATSVIAFQIEEALRARGLDRVRLERRLSPPWTTAWISEEGRRKLAAYGIVPPDESAGPASPLSRLGGRRARRELPALRVGAHQPGQRVRLDAVQGAVPLRRLPGAVRLLQVPLTAWRASTRSR